MLDGCRSAIVPIFIDSDPEETQDQEDDQDICAFLSSTITTSTSIAGPSRSRFAQKSKGIVARVDRKGKRRAEEDVILGISESSALMDKFERFENSILSKVCPTLLNIFPHLTYRKTIQLEVYYTDRFPHGYQYHIRDA